MQVLQIIVIRMQLAEESQNKLDISLKVGLTGFLEGIADLYFSLGIRRLDSLSELCYSTGLILKSY